ncbi:TPA: hypothetical protein N0F65_007099 [Lagenidium giganteum]|uniref:Uncharacterized protein n=1 Tax=Lagenidium giganteum TaxID=4803 RepID=A0AAV2YHV8_9STRA|nr:TPA: hypothetical protein N0F65_007099 [Lagenidium giganteum]
MKQNYEVLSMVCQDAEVKAGRKSKQWATAS